MTENNEKPSNITSTNDVGDAPITPTGPLGKFTMELDDNGNYTFTASIRSDHKDNPITRLGLAAALTSAVQKYLSGLIS